MPSDPVKAGRIGGSRNTPAQQEARRRNGFQKKPAQPVTKPSPLQIEVEVFGGTDDSDFDQRTGREVG